MTGVKELIEERIDSICQLSYGRFHFGYKPAVRAMLVDAVKLHPRAPAHDVARAIGTALEQIHEADQCDAQRLEVVRYASEQLLAACRSLSPN